MWKNYFKIAWRNISNSKWLSSINIAGLAIGMTCCMLLWVYIRSESNYDQHHQNTSDLFLVNSEAITTAGNEEYPMLSAPYAAALQLEFPEIDQTTRLLVNDNKTLLQVREAGKTVRSFYESKAYHVDTTFFNIFSYEFIEGNPKEALQDRNSVVLSEEVAAKLFGDSPALGKIIRIMGAVGYDEDFKVTGVYKDESHRSHIDARFFVPITAGWVGNWLRDQQHNFSSNNVFYTYVKLNSESDSENLQAKLPLFMEKYAGKDLKEAGFDKRIFLIPIENLHLYDKLSNIVSATSSKVYLNLLGLIAFFILLIACINFMNLATASSMKRAAEVGIRKVMGANRSLLIWQFFSETIVMSVVCLFLAFALFSFVLPVFNQITGKTFNFSVIYEPEILVGFVILTLLTGAIAGSYPAIFLSNFNPVKVLKGKFTNSVSGKSLRQGLVIFQFIISVGLISTTLIMQKQINFMRNKPLGFIKDQQIVIPLNSNEARKSYNTFKNEALQSTNVIDAAGAQYYPGIPNITSFSFYRPDQSNNDIRSVKYNLVDPYLIKMMGFKEIAGRTFSPEVPADTTNRIVVNEATLRAFDIPLERAVGYKLNFDWQGQTNSFEIIGVLQDFHFEGLHHQIEPYAFMLRSPENYNYLIVHVKASDIGKTLDYLEQKWNEFIPEEPFEYSFMDEDFYKNYIAEERTSKIIASFTIISVFISCFGLFGLTTFAAQQRTKEIGIRKILGASVANLLALLSKDFLKLVFIAIIIATPVAWYAMNGWLQNFVYKIQIDWWMFLLSGLVVIFIALFTISFQAIKAALQNPVHSVKNE